MNLQFLRFSTICAGYEHRIEIVFEFYRFVHSPILISLLFQLVLMHSPNSSECLLVSFTKVICLFKLS